MDQKDLIALSRTPFIDSHGSIWCVDIPISGKEVGRIRETICLFFRDKRDQCLPWRGNSTSSRHFVSLCMSC